MFVCSISRFSRGFVSFGVLIRVCVSICVILGGI